MDPDAVRKGAEQFGSAAATTGVNGWPVEVGLSDKFGTKIGQGVVVSTGPIHNTYEVLVTLDRSDFSPRPQGGSAIPPWDERDVALDLRNQFAKLIASKVSGLEPSDINPEQDDYNMADGFAAVIEREWR